MKIENFRNSIDSVSPTEAQKVIMLKNILLKEKPRENRHTRMRGPLAITAAILLCIILSVTVAAATVPAVSEYFKEVFGIKAELLTEMGAGIEVLDQTSTSGMISISLDSVIRDERNIFVLVTVERKDNKPFGEHSVFENYDFRMLDTRQISGWGASYGFIESNKNPYARTCLIAVNANEVIRGKKFTLAFSNLKERDAKDASVVVIGGSWSITFKAENRYNARSIKINDSATSIERLIVSPVTISYYTKEAMSWDGRISIKYKDNSAAAFTNGEGISGYMSGNYENGKHYVTVCLNEPIDVNDIETITVNGYEMGLN